MKRYLTFLLFIYPTCLFGQIAIEGTVLDEQNAPVTYASVSLVNGNGGTISNELGQFVLTVSALPTELAVSHVAYRKVFYVVHDSSSKTTILLEPVPHYLAEVTVDGNEAIGLIKQAYDHAVANKQIFQYGKAFYRQTSFMDSKATEVLEAFFDTRVNSNGIDAWKITQGRFAKKNIKGSLDFLNFSTYTTGSGNYQETPKNILLPLSREGFDRYDFEITNTYNEKDGELVEITCTPHANLPKPAFEGRLFIDRNSKQLLKMTGKVALGDRGIELKFNRRPVPFQNLVLTTEMAYQKNLTTRFALSYIKMALDFTYTVEGTSHTASTKSLCTLYAFDASLNHTHFKKKSKNTNDLKAVKSVGYKAEFWKDNPVVKRTPIEQGIIESFEAEGAFGNYLPGN
ncbi:MAG TPA: carboxypeptidase-like regulatory domain-containing protein [Chryseolinea sp.]